MYKLKIEGGSYLSSNMGSMKKEFFFLDMDSIKREFEIVNNSAKADYILCKNNVPDISFSSKVILFMIEPPLSGMKRKLYHSFDKFHTVICFDPKSGKLNQFPFKGGYTFFPHKPYTEEFIKHEDITLTDRKIFYAGRRSQRFENLPNDFNIVPLCDIRKKMVDELYQHPKIAAIIGMLWEGKAKEVRSTDIFKGKRIPWPTKRHAKISDINEFNADFIMCLENCMQKGYISEKIHDGFNSDRIVLYLGEPDIEKYIPLNCFIDLRPYFNKETKEFNMKKIIELTQKMTQEEYNTIINNARKWRETISKDVWEKDKEKLTNLLIARIKFNK